MEPARINPDVSQHQPSALQRIGKLFGHLWKTIIELPQSLLSLIKRIGTAVSNIFSSKSSSPDSKTLLGKVVPKTDKAGAKTQEDNEDQDWDIQELFEHAEVKSKPAAAEKKPLAPAEGKSLSEDDFLALAVERAMGAQGLIEKMNEKKPAGIDDYQSYIGQLNEQLAPLKEVQRHLNDFPDVNQMVRETVAALEKKIAGLQKEGSAKSVGKISSENPLQEMGAMAAERQVDFNAVAFGVISNAVADSEVIWEMYQSAQELLEVIVAESKELPEKMKTKKNQPETIKKYLEYIGQLNNQIELLSSEDLSADDNIKSIKLALEDKVSELEKGLSAQVASHYKIKENGGAGDCLFLSVQQQVKGSNAGPQYYRAIAADYILEHWREFEIDLENFTGKAVTLKTVQAYCLKLKTTNMWGGDIELKALSEVLKTPIVVISNSNKINGAKWGRIVGAQYNQLNNPPIILQYDGSTHYQSRIQK